MKLRHLLFALLITGCTYLPQANVSRGQTVVVKTKIADSNLTTKAVVTPYTSASINHLLLQLMYMPSQTVISSVDIPGAQLNLPIKLTNLEANRSYRIKATAYKASGTSVSDAISTDDALSRLDFATTNDDQPSIVTLPVKLIDKDFNGIGTSSIAVTNGGYNFAASESIAFLPPLVTTLAGTNQAGSATGSLAAARFNSPFGITRTGTTGQLLVSDTGNNRIVSIYNGVVDKYLDAPAKWISFRWGGLQYDSAAAGGIVSSYYGDPLKNTLTSTGLSHNYSGDEWSEDLGLSNPQGITMPYPTVLTNTPTTDIFYIADTGHNKILKYQGLTSLDYGYSNLTILATYGDGTAGTTDGSASTARFNAPKGLILDSLGNLYVADSGNHRIRCIDPAGNVTTYAGPTGAAEAGFADGAGTAARFNSPTGLEIDSNGNLYVVDTGNHCIRYLKRIY